MNIGVVSTLFPTRRNPTAGIFVKDELDRLAGFADIRLIAPFPNQRWLLERSSGLVTTSYPVRAPFVFAFHRWFFQNLYPSNLAKKLTITGKKFFRDCDIVHAHNGFPEGVAAVKAFSGKHPVVITLHGSDVNYFAMKQNLRPMIVDALNRAAHLICVGSTLRRKLTDLGVLTPMSVIPNGVDTDIFRPAEKTEASLRLGLDPNRYRVIFAGNFVPVKGVEHLIRAFPDVRAMFPDCELVLLGADQGKGDRMRYKTGIDQAGINDSVMISDRVQHCDLPIWLQASDVLVLPSLNEGFGLVAAEALACGRPVVSTKSGGPEDIVVEATGELVEPGDHAALSRAIATVLNGEGIGDAAFLAESARTRFSFEKVTAMILDVYKDVLDT